MSNPCLFCRIVRGELPCSKVYEDEHTLAFMDIGPVIKGHVLVIPKAHHTDITGVPAETLAQVIRTVQKAASAQLNGLRADGVNVHQSNGAVAGQVVPHLHFHVIPRFEGDGHRWNWAAKKYESIQEMSETSDRLRKSWTDGI